MISNEANGVMGVVEVVFATVTVLATLESLLHKPVLPSLPFRRKKRSWLRRMKTKKSRETNVPALDPIAHPLASPTQIPTRTHPPPTLATMVDITNIVLANLTTVAQNRVPPLHASSPENT